MVSTGIRTTNGTITNIIILMVMVAGMDAAEAEVVGIIAGRVVLVKQVPANSGSQFTRSVAMLQFL
jgi:hypothetical protein